MTYDKTILDPKAVYLANKANGFWDGRINMILAAESLQERPAYKGLPKTAKHLIFSQFLGLIDSELWEAWQARKEEKNADRGAVVKANSITDTEEFRAFFKANIKDTYQDEIADAVIFALDLMGGFGQPLQIEGILIDQIGDENDIVLNAMRISNYAFHRLRKDGEDLFWPQINRLIAYLHAYFGHWLESHVKAKRRFNATRPKMHGGKQF